MRAAARAGHRAQGAGRRAGGGAGSGAPRPAVCEQKQRGHLHVGLFPGSPFRRECSTRMTRNNKIALRGEFRMASRLAQDAVADFCQTVCVAADSCGPAMT